MSLWIACSLLCLVQFFAALPWLAVLDLPTFLKLVRRPATWAYAVGGIVVAGGILAFLLGTVQVRERLELYGRIYATVLLLQLLPDFFVILFAGLLLMWPRGGAVALAAYREGVRQPLFWLIVSVAGLGILTSIFIPYFTFGDDIKMMKHLGFDLTMLAAVLFTVVIAAMSISEEIEGRTAITLMSKPVSRREFLLGKYAGILLAGLTMTGMLAWCLQWALYFMPGFVWMPDTSDPLQSQIQPAFLWVAEGVAPSGEASFFLRGAALWWANSVALTPGLVMGFSQVMVLLGIAAALATRLPMVLTLVGCLVLYFLGNLAAVLVLRAQQLQRQYAIDHQGQSSATLDLVQFMARLFDTVLPALEYFNMGPAIVRDRPLPLGDYCLYVGSVMVYAVLYTLIALLFGLILFEDRDLA